MPEHELVDAWFPADLPGPQDWEDRYPPRTGPPGAEVTRFAPSPTGTLHLGGVYAAALASDLARQSGGRYLVRIEDTDRRREVVGAAAEFDRVFAYLGLDPDEGGSEGDWGPYRQSDRASIYASYVRDLVRRGLAYPCFCSKESLAESSAEQRRSRSALGYYGKWAHCRSLSPQEAHRRIAGGRRYSIRSRCPQAIPGRIGFTDRIRGSVAMLDNGNDVVILKSADHDGERLPTYHFAHVVDDHLMRVTLVIRGDEWLSSVPLHRQLHEALGFRPPVYAHIAPLMKVHGASRRKLSKRKDPESAAAFYLDAGYPAPVMLHYLRGLANSRLMDTATADALAAPVRLEEMRTAGPMVDLGKLRSLSRDYIAALAPAEGRRGLADWARLHDGELHRALDRDPRLADGAFALAHGGAGQPRKDVACWSEFRAGYGFLFPALHVPVTDNADRRFGGLDPDLIVDLAEDLITGYRHHDDADSWFGQIRSLARRHGFAPEAPAAQTGRDRSPGSIREVASVIRVCLAGRTTSPDLFQIAQVLGEEEVIRRLRLLRGSEQRIRRDAEPACS
jgi:glutamyl-tRNA synthetase